MPKVYIAYDAHGTEPVVTLSIERLLKVRKELPTTSIRVMTFTCSDSNANESCVWDSLEDHEMERRSRLLRDLVSLDEERKAIEMQLAALKPPQ